MHDAPWVVDARYGGLHGIGRYAAEVVPRLSVPHLLYNGRSSPTSPLDLLNLRRLRVSRRKPYYSPGFGAAFGLRTQVLTVHDLTHVHLRRDSKDNARQAYYEHVVKPAVIRSGHVITVSETSANDIRTWLGDTSHVEVHNFGNGCSDAFTRRGPLPDTQAPYLLYVGNFKPHKNPALAMAAAANLSEYELIIVTNDEAAATTAVRATGISGRTRVMSGLSDTELARLYRGASALLFPSIWEGFGFPVLEAIRCGTNVAYLEECLSAQEIAQGTQFSSKDSLGVAGYTTAVEAAATSAFREPDTSQYEWDAVALAVDGLLARLAGSAAA